MKNKLTVLTAMFVLPFGGASHASGAVPESSFYFGVGANFNSTKVQDQKIEATGTSNASNKTTGEFMASGSAGGPPIDLHMPSQTGFSPDVQAGYFKHFQDSSWLWGFKFSYNGLDLTSTKRNFLIPQYGSYGSTPFTGNATVRAFKSSVSNQFSFVPYVGHSFDRGFVYAGVGPTISRIKTDVDNLIGFADINGNRTDVSGTPQNFSSSKWVVGGTATVGATYFLSSSWFLDANYSASMTPNKTANYSSTFSNTHGNTNVDYSGSLIGSSSAKTVTQSISLTINRAF